MQSEDVSRHEIHTEETAHLQGLMKGGRIQTTGNETSGEQQQQQQPGAVCWPVEP